jgi:hypothetical protein
MCATCPAHLIRLDFTTRTILGKEYRSFSSSLCSFLHSPVTSTLNHTAVNCKAEGEGNRMMWDCSILTTAKHN